MLKLINGGKDGSEAFVESFSDNIAGFQQMFLDYARQLEATPVATYIEHQDILADMMIELKSRGQTFRDVETFRHELERGQYQVQYTRGSLNWSTDTNLVNVTSLQDALVSEVLVERFQNEPHLVIGRTLERFPNSLNRAISESGRI
jgi:hypothetical protein